MDMPLSRRDFIKMAAAVFGACVSAKATGGVAEAAQIGTPVIMYHTTAYGITSEIFVDQMEALYRMDCKTIGFEELYDSLKKRLNLPYGRVVLTFDDIGNQLAKSGLQETHDDFWENIYPVLNKYGFKGVLGVVTGGISNEGWTWDEIRRLADEGHEIASHSATHNLGMNQAYLNRPGGFSREQFIDEFRRSRYDIQNNTGRAPITYIWPFGAVKYGSDAAEIYPVRVTVWETGPVSGLSQLGSVPRYHPDGHVNDFGITIARALGFGGPTATQLEKSTGDTDTYTEKNRNYGVGFNSEALRARHAEKFRDVET